MDRTVRGLFGRGVFGTGWLQAGLSLLLAAAVYVANEVYELLNHGPAVLHLQTALDRALPLLPIFVIPYISLNPFVYASLILFLLLRTRIFQSAALSMLGAWLVSYLFYYFLQSEVIRPEILGPGLLNELLRGVYAGDRPYNDFPSLHTSISTILALHWLRLDRRVGLLVSVWVALIVLSTIFVKQHYVADLLLGLALAFGVSRLFARLLPDK